MKPAPDLLDLFFRPRGIAVLGASATAGKLGNAVVRNLRAGGFAGSVYAVNRSGAAVEGAPGLARLADAPLPVDLAFLAVPAGHAEAALADCVRAGVRAVVVGASGFAELGTDAGRDLQARLAQAARAAGIRAIGPNTNGLLGVRDGIALGYNAAHGVRWRGGGVSILSHSGALFDGIAQRIHALGGGLNRFVAVGNEMDVGLLDLLEALVDDAGTEVIGLVIEGLADGPRLRAVAQRLARAGKRVVALKIGRSEAGAQAAQAHSARLAGSVRAWDALLRACGFASVRTVEALAGACVVRSVPTPAAFDPRLLCLTTSGAGGALLADLATERGLPMAPGTFAPHTRQVIAALPTHGPVRHPVDMGALGDWALLDPVLLALEDEGLGGPMAVYAHSAPAPGMDARLAQAVIARRQRTGLPVVVVAPGGLAPAVADGYAEAGVPVFHDATTCFDSLAAWWQAPPERPADPRGPVAGVAQALAACADDALLAEDESAAVLRQAGLPLVRSAAACDADEAVAQAGRLGYPLVLKALAPGIAHKHQAGLVDLHIAGEDALRAAFARQAARVAELGLAAGTRWLLQPLLRGDLELLCGLSTDPALGQFLVWGLGGVRAEVFDEVDLVALPAAPEVLRDRLAASRCGRLLAAMGTGGARLADFGDLLVTLADLAAGHGDAIAAVDLNPVLVTADAVVAVDALLVRRA